jgi:RNA polymerase sigma-70 factor (ECF subfamily)
MTANVDPHAKCAACYSAHRSYVRTVVQRAGIPAADVEDAVQDVFCVLLDRISELPHEACLRRWLGAVAAFVCSNRRRSDGRRAKWLDTRAALNIDRDCPDLSTASMHTRHEQMQLLERALAQLDTRQQQVLRLAIVEERSAREIAELTGLSPNTVSSRLRAARLRSRHIEQQCSAVGRRSSGAPSMRDDSAPACPASCRTSAPVSA